MTESEKHSYIGALAGASRLVPFTNASAPAPFDPDQALVFNEAAGRVLVLARNSTTGAFELVGNQKMSPPAATGVQFESSKSVVYVSPRTVASGGRITKAFSSALTSPIAVVLDSDLGRAVATQWCRITPDTGPGGEFLFHSRARMLVVRSEALAEVASMKTPDEPLMILRGQPYDAATPNVFGSDVFVLYRNKTFVDRYTWLADRNELRLADRFNIPRCNEALHATFDGTRLVIVAATRVTVFDVADEAVVWSHHDPNGLFSSLGTTLKPSTTEYEDGADDEDYRAAVFRARFNPGRDRLVRDVYQSGDHFSRLSHVVGSLKAPRDSVTLGPVQPIVALVNRRWLVLDPATGRLVTSGDLVFRFRGQDVAEGLEPGPADGDAAEDRLISLDTVAGIRLVWTGTPSWRTDAEGLRCAYFDGATHADFGSRKQVFIAEAFSLTAWVRFESSYADGTYTVIGGGTLGQMLIVTRAGVVSSVGIGGSTVVVPELFDGAWHHIAVTRANDTANILVYSDGVLRGSPGSPPPPIDAEAGDMSLRRLALGKSTGATAHYFKGWLGDTRIYQLEASASYIAALEDAGPEGVARTEVLVPPPVITSSLTASVTEDTVFNYTITATGAGPIYFGVVDPPAWLTSINPLTGAISGTPTEMGTEVLVIRASGAGGMSTALLVVTITSMVGDLSAVRVNSAITDSWLDRANLKLYITGGGTQFTDASGTYARNNAGCLDLQTGLWTAWAPVLSSANSTIWSRSDSPWVYIGGPTGVNGAPSGRTKRVDKTTGASDAGFEIAETTVDYIVDATPIGGAIWAGQHYNGSQYVATKYSSAGVKDPGNVYVRSTAQSVSGCYPTTITPGGFGLGSAPSSVSPGPPYVAQGVCQFDLTTGLVIAATYGPASAAAYPSKEVVNNRVTITGGFTTVRDASLATVQSGLNNVCVLSDTLSTVYPFNVTFVCSDATRCAAIDPKNNNVFVGGNITSVAGDSNRKTVFKMKADGTLDTAFFPDFASGGASIQLAVVSDALIVMGNWTAQVNKQIRPYFAVLRTDTGQLRGG